VSGDLSKDCPDDLPLPPQITREQARIVYDSGLWRDWTKRERATFQLNQERQAMPFQTFHEAVENVLGRPVYTHEFGLNWHGLRRELLQGAPSPTFAEILALIPEEKRVVVVFDAEGEGSR